MKRFCERIGKKVSRRDLVAAVLKPGKPHAWRKVFLDVMADTIVDTVGFLARTVHRTSPATSMGLMSSGPRAHCREGRRWHDLAAALADGRPLFSRPPLGSYSESSLRSLYYTHDSIKLTRFALPGRTSRSHSTPRAPPSPSSR
jgi:hypothetical protein